MKSIKLFLLISSLLTGVSAFGAALDADRGTTDYYSQFSEEMKNRFFKEFSKNDVNYYFNKMNEVSRNIEMPAPGELHADINPDRMSFNIRFALQNKRIREEEEYFRTRKLDLESTTVRGVSPLVMNVYEGEGRCPSLRLCFARMCRRVVDPVEEAKELVKEEAGSHLTRREFNRLQAAIALGNRYDIPGHEKLNEQIRQRHEGITTGEIIRSAAGGVASASIGILRLLGSN